MFRTFIYTGAASFLWTEEKNKKNNYSRFGGFYSCIKWMCRNRTGETNVSSCTGSRVVRRWLDTHLRNAGTSECRRTGKRERESQNSVLSIKGNDFNEIEKIYNRSQEKISGYGTFAGVDPQESAGAVGALEGTAGISEKEPLIGENVYVFRSEYPERS